MFEIANRTPELELVGFFLGTKSPVDQMSAAIDKLPPIRDRLKSPVASHTIQIIEEVKSTKNEWEVTKLVITNKNDVDITVEQKNQFVERTKDKSERLVETIDKYIAIVNKIDQGSFREQMKYRR
jgi:hypothetical protein